MHALVGHTGNGGPLEAVSALGVLVQLGRGGDGDERGFDGRAALFPFAAFLNGLLDYIDRFSESTLRMLTQPSSPEKR